MYVLVGESLQFGLIGSAGLILDVDEVKAALPGRTGGVDSVLADDGVGGFAAAQPLEDFVEHLGVSLALRALCGVEELEIVCDAQPGEYFSTFLYRSRMTCRMAGS